MRDVTCYAFLAGIDVVQLAQKLWTEGSSDLDEVVEQCREKVQSQLSEISASGKEVETMKAKLQTTRTRLEQAREAAKKQKAEQDEELNKAMQAPSIVDEAKQQQISELQQMEEWAMTMQATMRKISGKVTLFDVLDALSVCLSGVYVSLDDLAMCYPIAMLM
jgi:chromosome segregation ATPase